MGLCVIIRQEALLRTSSELWWHRTVRLIFVILCIRLFPHAGEIVADLLPLEHYSYLWDSVHHGVQLLLVLTVMMLLTRGFSLRDIGFNLNHAAWSLKVSGIFCGVWSAAMIVRILLSGPSAASEPGDMLFAWTLAGISEEVLFRAFVIGMLHPVFYRTIPVFGTYISIAGVISAALFALSQLSFSFQPFAISYVDPLQQLLLLGFGIFYAVMFEYTHSLLGPVLVHSIAAGLYMSLSALLRFFGA